MNFFSHSRKHQKNTITSTFFIHLSTFTLTAGSHLCLKSGSSLEYHRSISRVPARYICIRITLSNTCHPDRFPKVFLPRQTTKLKLCTVQTCISGGEGTRGVFLIPYPPTNQPTYLFHGSRTRIIPERGKKKETSF